MVKKQLAQRLKDLTQAMDTRMASIKTAYDEGDWRTVRDDVIAMENLMARFDELNILAHS